MAYSVSKMKQFVFIFLYFLYRSASAKVLLISMDGFRWDYINQVNTPNFDAFARNGTRANFINNTFVTKTFPCHYTIATGLYEESHGIVANHMWDPTLNDSFSMRSKESKWWNGGEPLWVTSMKQGKNSAVYFWPGSESEIRGFRPLIYKAYSDHDPFRHRVDTVVDWLMNDTLNIQLAMLYFPEPDHTGHLFGPDSQQVRDKVVEMDGILGYLMQKFDQNSLWQSVDVLVTSDHGMAGIDATARAIDLSLYIDLDAIDKDPTYGPTANILPLPGKEDELIRNMSGIDHMRLYKKEDIPEHWHYKNNPRVLPILAVADEGWLVLKNVSEYKDMAERGTHGYDNALMSMRPIFYARGPDIKLNYTTPSFNSVDIYPLVCKLLGLNPAPNNGTLRNTQGFIAVHETSSAGGLYPTVVCILLTVCRILF